MRCQPNMMRVAFLGPWILLASATGSVFAGGAVNDALATKCLRLQSQSAAAGMFGCTKLVYLRSTCDLPAVAQIGATQRLFSGTLRRTIPVVVPPGGAQLVDCAWWSGAMAPSEHRLLAAWFIESPHVPGGPEHDRPDPP